MSRSFVVVLVLLFLAASCLIVVKPVSGVSTVGNSWVEKAPMHVARGGLGVAVVNGKIFAIGGSTETVSHSLIVSGGIVGINEGYDPATDTWIMRTPMPTPRDFFAIAVYQNKIYCIGGLTSNGNTTGVNEVYDPATDTWETKAPMPTARSLLQANVVNGKVYLIGGDPNGTVNEVYDPATDSWAIKSSMPTSSSHYASTVFNNKIYVIGGFYAGYKNQIYDPQTDSWSLGAPPPYALVGAAAATVGVMAPERIYVFSEGAANQIYDPKNNTWAVGADVPTERNYFGAAVVNDTLYLMGGSILNYPLGAIFDVIYDDTPIAVNEQYTPVGYGTVPPFLSVLSPENKNYSLSDVLLNFTVNRSVSWVGYSLDGRGNVTVAGNATLSGLSNGLHNITVYANDTLGNIGASQTITFAVAKPEPFPTATLATVSGASAVVVVAGVLVYFKKRKSATHRIIEGQSFD